MERVLLCPSATLICDEELTGGNRWFHRFYNCHGTAFRVARRPVYNVGRGLTSGHCDNQYCCVHPLELTGRKTPNYLHVLWSCFTIQCFSEEVLHRGPKPHEFLEQFAAEGVVGWGLWGRRREGVGGVVIPIIIAVTTRLM